MYVKLKKDYFRKIKKDNKKAIIEAGIFIKNKLVKNVSYDTGELRRSIHLDIKSESRVLVGSNKTQAYIQEHGRKPGKFPNMDSLVGRSIRNLGLTGRRTLGYDEQPTQTKQVIFLVARKIAQKGIKAKQVFWKTWRDNKYKALKVYRKSFKNNN